MKLRNVVAIALLFGMSLTLPGRKSSVTATLKEKKDSGLSNWQKACIDEIDGYLKNQLAHVDLHYAILFNLFTVTFYLDQADACESVRDLLTSLSSAICDGEVKIDKDFFIK